MASAPVSRKRLRLTAASEPISARAALASRLLEVPQILRSRASAAGVDGIDEFLRQLGRSIAETMGLLPEAAESARQLLREKRLELHAAIDVRFDELDTLVKDAEAAKVAALERELVTVEAVLERWKKDSADIIGAATSLSDSAFETQHSALSSGLDDIEAQIQALPTVTVEPPLMGLVADTTVLLAAFAGFGRLIAPLAVTAADLSLQDAPSFVRAGDTLHLRLVLGPRHASQSAEELSFSLGILETTTVVDAALSSGIKSRALVASLAHDPTIRSLSISLPIPSSAYAYEYVVINSVEVSGHRVMGFPVELLIRRGMSAPLRLESAVSDTVSPCISPNGRIFVPSEENGTIQVYNAEGAALRAIRLARLGLARDTPWTAFAVGDTPTLLLAEADSRSRVVACDPSTQEVRWSFNLEDSMCCGGVAVLPAQRVAIVNSFHQRRLFIHRLSDGSRVGSFRVSRLAMYVATHSATSTVFVVCQAKRGSSYAVHAWSCLDDGSRLTQLGPVESAGDKNNFRLLAVMPPASGKRTSFLLVATCDSPNIRVVSLPDFALVHKHTLEGMKVMGLAADPWGGTLAVCDAESNAVHILAWPLPGMPPLA